MANYPDLPISADGYEIQPDEGVQRGRASDGTLRGRRLYPATRYTVTLTHPALEPAQMLVLEEFYTSHRDDAVTWLDPLTQRAYSLQMLGPPAHVGVRGATLLDVKMTMEGTRG